MVQIDYTRYYSNSELLHTLDALRDEFPALVALESLGSSYEGRDIWLVTLTNTATGEPRSKPSFWLDANIHATEVTGTMAALHVLDTLLRGYGSDPRCTLLLDSTTFYIVPRFNPDGAERAISTPYGVRSSVRPYPFTERKDGLYPDDVDGNGLLLTMRLVDPTGDWKISQHDPRVMVKRGPDEVGGTYYRILPEGTIKNFDGVTIKASRPLEGLDINRNFPGAWRPENEQYGAGPFPTSEPEIRAVVEFLTAHPEIHSAITYHTYSGALLRPMSGHSDDEFDLHDLEVYKAVGARGTELTGYPNVSVFHDFRYHPKEIISGVFDDWLYDHLGIFAWTVELWDLAGEAGIKDRKFIEWMRQHPEEDDLKLMAWNDAHAAGAAFLAWQPFTHPQLGPMEIGGWHPMYAFRNPPPAHLLATCEKSTAFVLSHALIAPLLRIPLLRAEPLGGDLYHITAVVQNQGFLPTYGSKQALKRRAPLPLEAALHLPEGASVVTGELRQEIDHLEGRSERLDRFNSGATSDRRRLEWSVRLPAGSTLELEVHGGRGGTGRASVSVSGAAASDS